MPNRKLYLAGPMSGIAEFNFPAFHLWARRFRDKGWEVFNPAEKDMERHGGVDISKGNDEGSQAYAAEVHGFSLRDALAEDCAFICKEAQAIAMLPGWENSKGARAEHALAVALSLEIHYVEQF